MAAARRKGKNMQPNDEKALPTSADFRAWLQDALAILGVSAASVSSAVGVHRNTLPAFRKRPARSSQLDNARAVAGHLHALAAAKGLRLGFPGGRQNGQ